MDIINVSTITPVYSGKEYLVELIEEILKIRESWVSRNLSINLLEAIFVDDASTDGSLYILKEYQQKYHWIKVIQLSKNFGQHPATVAGILHSSGDWIFTLDEDLQHHPKFFEQLLKGIIEQQSDVVYAKPKTNVHSSFFRDFSSKTYKLFLAKLSGNPNIQFFNSFRLIRGSIARAAASVSCHDGYFDIVLSWFTNNISNISLPLKDLRYQKDKKSGYNILKLLSHARKLLISSHAKIIRVSSLIGALAIFISTFYGSYVLTQSFFFPETIGIAGWTSLMIIGLFFGGIISFFLGISLEYTDVILLQLQGKPTFFIVDRSSDTHMKNQIEKLL